MTMIFDVKKAVNQIYNHLNLNDNHPVLAVIRVGDDFGSKSYLKSIEKELSAVGIRLKEIHLDDSVSNETFQEELEKLNSDENINAILVLKPLPEGLEININPKKDVDALSAENLGKLVLDEEAFYPCTPEGILYLLDDNGIELKSKNVVIVNNSEVIGKPLSLLLTNRFATVTLCHEFTKDLGKFTKDADIVITAAGVPNLITPEMLSPDSIVIDAGVSVISQDGKRIRVGDLSPGCETKASLLTSATPGLGGGVGPLTTAILAKHISETIK